MDQSINIIMVDGKIDLPNSEQISIITKETLDNLKGVVWESHKLQNNADKLRGKAEQAKRRAKKFLQRVIASHGVRYDIKTEAVGISKEDDTIYLGEKLRVVNDPEATPLINDKIVGKLFKYERRKYNELLDSYNFVAGQIDKHNIIVQENEKKLIAFENIVLVDKKYDKEEQCLVVSGSSGIVLLVDKKEIG